MEAIARLILLFLSVVVVVLTAFGISGSYENKSYLTDTYMIDVQLNQLNLSALIDVSNLSSSLAARELETTVDFERVKRNGNDLYDLSERFISDLYDLSDLSDRDLALTLGLLTLSISLSISSILNEAYADIGLSDVYSFSYWGYCKGNVTSEEEDSGNSFFKAFDNNNLDFTWCSSPQVGYRVDPLAIFKEEVTNAINDNTVKTPNVAILESLLNSITYDSFLLPGNLREEIDLMNNLTVASFALLLIAAALGFLSVVVQLFGCCLSPHSVCLSFFDFALQVVLMICMLLGAGLVTGTNIYVRGVVNDKGSDLGIRSYLSVNFYAFIWSASAAAILIVVLSVLMHCCGAFRRSTYLKVSPNMASEHYQPQK